MSTAPGSARDEKVWRPDSEWTPPEGATIDLWLLDLHVGPEDWAVLSAEERATADRISVRRKGNQKAAARGRLRRILAGYLNQPPAALDFEYGKHGKPSLRDIPELCFNLSHSADVGLVGVTWGTRIGVDVERVRERRLLRRIGQRFFSEPEAAELHPLSDTEHMARFYRLWAHKEAYLKAWGTGLTFGSNRFTLDLPPQESGQLVSTEMAGDDPARWIFADVSVDPAFAAAICYEGGVRTIRYYGRPVR